MPFMFLFCSSRGLELHGLGLGHQTQQRGARRDRRDALSPCWGLWAKLRFRGCRGPPTVRCCGFSAPPNPPCAASLSLRHGVLWLKPAVSRPRPAGAVKPRKGGTSRTASFQLFDPQTRIVLPRRRIPQRPGPRIHMFNADNELVTVWPPPRPAASAAPRQIR